LVEAGSLPGGFAEVLRSWDEAAAGSSSGSGGGMAQASARSGISISMTDLQFLHPFERIEKAIEIATGQAPLALQHHAASATENAVAQAVAGSSGRDAQQASAVAVPSALAVPAYKDLLEEPLRSGLACCSEPAQKKRKLVKVPTNYITPARAENEHDGHEEVDRGEVVLTVSLYHSSKDMKVAQYRFLGSQKLTALRDRMYCLADHILDGPETKSSFLFIENVFYNDLRSSKALDYSEHVMRWANEGERFKAPGVGMNMTATRMEEVAFRELPGVRIGAQYVLCHQGDCEHIVTFDEIRLFRHESDHCNRLAYPIQLFEGQHSVRKCTICKIHSAKKVTHGDRLAPESPCFFCDECYHNCHYKKDNEGKNWVLIYTDFQVFPYYHE